jgi:uncharacterized protein involved in response to NO
MLGNRIGDTGLPLAAGPVTRAIYLLITIAAVLRVVSPLAGEQAMLVLWLAGAAWSCALTAAFCCGSRVEGAAAGAL